MTFALMFMFMNAPGQTWQPHVDKDFATMEDCEKAARAKIAELGAALPLGGHLKTIHRCFVWSIPKTTTGDAQ